MSIFITYSQQFFNRFPADYSAFSTQITQFREKLETTASTTNYTIKQVNICARKRALFQQELSENVLDIVSVHNPCVTVHDCKLKVDGTPLVENHTFRFDKAFDESAKTEDIYNSMCHPLLLAAIEGGVGTCFAYGQTGSGKTYTITSLEQMCARDIFSLLRERGLDEKYKVTISFFELSGEKTFDLLNEKTEVFVREDEHGDVHIRGLSSVEAETEEQLQEKISIGFNERSTKATKRNETSSRTHAICQITIVNKATPNEILGKMFFVDLAGQERGIDSIEHDEQCKRESIAINKSLMALKECIRYRAKEMKNPKTFVPFRGSRLTLLLKESFTKKNAVTTVIVTLSPGINFYQHSIDTCRFADRIKERGQQQCTDNDSLVTEPTDSCAQNPYLWDKREARAWVISLIGTDKRCKGENVFTPMDGKRMATLTEEEFALNCIVPGYGKLLYKEMGKLRLAFDKTKKYRVEPVKTAGARDSKNKTPEKPKQYSLVKQATPDKGKGAKAQHEDGGSPAVGTGTRERNPATRDTTVKQTPRGVARSASASFIVKPQAKERESSALSAKSSMIDEQKRACQAFEKVYQSIKMNCLRTLLKRDSQATVELKEALCAELSAESKEQGKELFEECYSAEEYFVQMQTAANKSFLRFLDKAQLTLDFVKQARTRAGSPASSVPAVTKALSGALGNFTLDEVAYSVFLLELCKKYPRLTQAVPLQTFWKVLVDALPGSDPHHVGRQFADFFSKRAGADVVETAFWTSFSERSPT